MANAAEELRDSAGGAVAELEDTLPATSRFVSRCVYSTFYVLSYGVVFPTMFVADSVPGGVPIVNGLLDGANAACGLVNEMRKKPARPKPENAEIPAGVPLSSATAANG